MNIWPILETLWRIPLLKTLAFNFNLWSLSGYPDTGYFWRVKEVDDGNFDKAAMSLYDQLKPMYQRLHAYVRHRLATLYPDHVTKDGPIPAHLLGKVHRAKLAFLSFFVPSTVLSELSRELLSNDFPDHSFQISVRLIFCSGLLSMAAT